MGDSKKPIAMAVKTIEAEMQVETETMVENKCPYFLLLLLCSLLITLSAFFYSFIPLLFLLYLVRVT